MRQSFLLWKPLLYGKDNRAFVPTPLGIQVCEILETNFPQIVDFNFTATIENDFDNIAANKINWIKVIRGFYGPFKANLDEKYNSVAKIDTTEKLMKSVKNAAHPWLFALVVLVSFWLVLTFLNARTPRLSNKTNSTLNAPNVRLVK